MAPKGLLAQARVIGGGNQTRGVLELMQRGLAAMEGHGNEAMQLPVEDLAAVLAHRLKEERRTGATSTPSGGGWMSNPTGDLILQFHQLMPGAMLAMPHGVTAWGEGQAKGSEAMLSLDLAQGVLSITDLSRNDDAEVEIDGVGDLAAIADTLAQAHHQARRAAAKGKPISTAASECPALQLRIRPADEQGLAVVELAGAAIRLHPLVFLQLLAEVYSLLAREIARSVDQRQALEALVPQRPEVAWERSHGS